MSPIECGWRIIHQLIKWREKKMTKTGIGMSSFVSKEELLLLLKGENYNFLETKAKEKKNSFLTRKKNKNARR